MQVLLAQETLEVYSVVANRLGVWCLKAELEDLAFKALHPEEYAWLQAQVADRQDAAALEATMRSIRKAMLEHGVQVGDVVKHACLVHSVETDQTQAAATSCAASARVNGISNRYIQLLAKGLNGSVSAAL